MTDQHTLIQQNFTIINAAIRDAEQDANRKGGHVDLIAVSKKQPLSRIKEALDTGHRSFGENRVQEAYKHWQDHRQNYPDLTLHLIGPLQSNKTADAVALFDVIHTVDRPKIARYIKAEMEKQQRAVKCLLQLNIGNEPQKSGVTPEGLEDLLNYCKEIDLKISGLMCIPPYGESSEPYFKDMAALALKYDLKELSMGMSDDYASAISMGATMVRVGSALFGERTT